MKRLLRAFVYSMLLAFLSLFSVAALWKAPAALAAALAAVSAIMLLVWRSREDVYLYIIVGISGALAELAAVGSGVWQYAMPDVRGIPLWLPLLWGIAGVFVQKIGLEIREFIRQPKRQKPRRHRRVP